jgi:2-polyprenyl-3-methyl-5-hydroxy-6-metoxy-1,4-benzoquinol methylase
VDVHLTAPAETPAAGQTTPPRTHFVDAYLSRTAPWVIGQPQPAIVALESGGWIRGRVLDAGCSTGERTIHLARLGYDVLGIDSPPHD